MSFDVEMCVGSQREVPATEYAICSDWKRIGKETSERKRDQLRYQRGDCDARISHREKLVDSRT